MKNLFFALFALLTITLSACSKDRRINNKLEGTWKVTIYENVNMPDGSSLILTFDKGKKGKGTGTAVGTGFFILSNFAFVYNIDNEKMTMSHGSTVDVYTVVDFSKDEIKLQTPEGKSIVMVPS